MHTFKMIGLMSGTSLDGVDIIHVTLTKKNEKSWDFSIISAETFPFETLLLDRLHQATSLSGSQLMNLDHDLGVFFGEIIQQFIRKNGIDTTQVDAIASHGQTIFHQPTKGYTTQIGNPAVIAVRTGIQTIGDFRTKDVLYGGQGAPLVPIGDLLLFQSIADGFLNIGGFANISYLKNDEMLAYDICPANLPLNLLSRSRNLEYDKNGALAQSGELNYFLLDLLNSLEYYTAPAPKSLGTEWLDQHFLPLLKLDKDIENNLATVVEHIAVQIAQALNQNSIKRVLITGGGAKNNFLIERLKRYYSGEIVAVSSQLVDFKEALIFALLGALHLNNEPNCLPQVTGARKAVCGGVLHQP